MAWSTSGLPVASLLIMMLTSRRKDRPWQPLPGAGAGTGTGAGAGEGRGEARGAGRVEFPGREEGRGDERGEERGEGRAPPPAHAVCWGEGYTAFRWWWWRSVAGVCG